MDSSPIFFIAALIAVLVAGLAAWQEGRAISTGLFVVGMCLLAARVFFLGMDLRASDPQAQAVFEDWRLLTYVPLPVTWLAFSLIYARGERRQFLKRWRLALGLVFIIPLSIAIAFRGHFISQMYRNIFEQRWNYQVGFASFTLHVVWLSSVVLVLMNLERTLRAAVGTMRWRIKYLVMGLGAFLCMDAYATSQVLISRSVDSSLQSVDAVALTLGCLLTIRSIWRRGAEAAVYPPPAIFQNSTTLVFGGAYLVIIGLLAKVTVWMGAEKSFSIKAFIILVVLLGGAMIALSDRARLRVRQFVSRYLQRPIYDYRTIWKEFSEHIAPHVNETEICKSVVKLVSKTFDALSTSLWVIDDKRENLTCLASTSLSEAAAENLQPKSSDAQEIIRHFQTQNEPVTIEKLQTPWAETLRKCHPVEFRTGGDRVCVPVIARGQLLAVMLLGDRVSGLRFSLQDFDLLRCVGDQAAASLLNTRLSKRLLQNKEMEAFQAMSTFFVHDLKNLANTLNLMLKNLPVHFDNPEFRADTLRGIGKTCDHINHLISRLSLLRGGLQIRPSETDLEKTLERALSQCPPSPGVQIERHFAALPKIILDSEQIEKVFTNLALNALEAVSPPGRITVESSQSNGWAVVAVSDTGCGMEPEFLTRSLFRPFQTTKKKGLGIGMFQSKMIVEAHGGRIEVESERGKGSTFRVLLPLSRPVT